MSNIKQIERQRKRLRAKIRRLRKRPYGTPLSAWRLKMYLAKYEYLGMVWAQQRKALGLDLTGAILLNDEGERISSKEFKQIAADRILGTNADETYLMAQYHWSGEGVEVPASEVFDDPYKDYPFKIYNSDGETPYFD